MVQVAPLRASGATSRWPTRSRPRTMKGNRPAIRLATPADFEPRVGRKVRLNTAPRPAELVLAQVRRMAPIIIAEAIAPAIGADFPAAFRVAVRGAVACAVAGRQLLSAIAGGAGPMSSTCRSFVRPTRCGVVRRSWPEVVDAAAARRLPKAFAGRKDAAISTRGTAASVNGSGLFRPHADCGDDRGHGDERLQHRHRLA